MAIDTHHHLWHFTEEEFGWIPESQKIIRKDFTTRDLESTIIDTPIDGVISVQARESVEETQMLLNAATECNKIIGVVGWIPLNMDTHSLLEPYLGHSKLKGIRHVLQGAQDHKWIKSKDFHEGIRCLTQNNLSYDLLIFSDQLSTAIDLVDQHPNQRFILDHIAKPVIQSKDLDQEWYTNIKELAKRNNVWCKLSGIITEVREIEWNSNLIEPYIKHTLESFAPNRVLFGSDWPVCLTRVSYSQWIAEMDKIMKQKTKDAQERFWTLNALSAYNI